MRQRKDDVKVLDREKGGLRCVHPLRLFPALAFRTVTVAAGIASDAALAAPIAFVDVSTHSRCATALNGTQIGALFERYDMSVDEVEGEVKSPGK
jgi:hypothetical protein